MYKIIWSFGVTFRKLWQTSTNPSRDASRTNSPRSQVKPTHMRVCAFVYTHTHLLNFSNFRVWSHKGGLLRSRTYRMVCMRCVCTYIHVLSACMFVCIVLCLHTCMAWGVSKGFLCMVLFYLIHYYYYYSICIHKYT